MKKLLAILLIAFFVVGLSSCAEDPLDTQPVIPEVSQDAIDRLQDQKSTNGRVTKHKRRSPNKKAIGEVFKTKG